MKKLSDILVNPTTSVQEAIAAIERGEVAIALVVDESKKLVGTVTDGDIRRAILRGLSMTSPVHEIMSKAPISAPADSGVTSLQRVMTQKSLRQVPLIDDSGAVTGLYVSDDLAAQDERPNHVVIMAGGRGTRLLPLTEKTPKPLLRIGDRPLLDVLIEQLASYGFVNISLAVHYRSEEIQEYIGDGSRLGVNVDYIKESRALGTAGALRLLELKNKEPIIVLYGDLLTKAHFGALLEYHTKGGYMMTLSVRRYSLQVPFGVIELDGHRIAEIEEKPSKNFLVNAGIYALHPEALTRIPRDTVSDMTELTRILVQEKAAVGSFPIHEYWMDIGQTDDYYRAVEDYKTHFCD